MLGTILAAILIPTVTFILITGWMVGLGVDSTVSALIGAAAVFGEIALIVKAKLPIGL